MKKLFSLLVLSLILTFTLMETWVDAKQDAELIAVLDLDRAGSTKTQASAVTDRLREELLRTNVYTLVDRSQIDNILKEQALQQTGCTSQECAVQVGQILGVHKIISGKVTKISNDLWQLSILMVDVETAQTLRAESVIHEGSFVGLLRTGVVTIATRLSGQRPTSVQLPSDKPKSTKPTQPKPPPLVKNTGPLLVNSYPQGADIFIDGVKTGLKTNILVGAVPVGEHIVSLSKGELIAVDRVYVDKGMIAQLDLTLTKKKGVLDVKSTPSRATVSLDGKYLGLTPLSFKGSEGGHFLKVELQGHIPFEEKIFLEAKKTTKIQTTLFIKSPEYLKKETQRKKTVNSYRRGLGESEWESYLRPYKKYWIGKAGPNPFVSSGAATGQLKIKSTPTGASVAIDGYPVNSRTEILFETISAGEHFVTLSKGNLGAVTKVFIEPGKTKKIDLALTPKKSVLMIISTPLYADVVLNGKKIGKTPLNYLTSPGNYTLNTSLKGYKPVERKINLEVGETKQVLIDMPLENKK